jgi:uncharacterized protein YcaQ
MIDVVSTWSNSGVNITERITALAARRIALAAQGFGRRRPVASGSADLISSAAVIRRAVDTMGILQLDSVNVVSRSHYLPVYSRIGPYSQPVLDRLTAHTAGRVHRAYVEYWAHEASLVPLATHPLLRWRMADSGQAWASIARVGLERPELVARVLDLVREKGPIRSGELGTPRAERRAGAMWNWHEGKLALEHLFWSGQVLAARRVNFERLYDLPERVLPPAVVNAPTPDRAEAQRELVRIAARAYGVATEPDLGDYFRLPRAESRDRVAELVATGELRPVRVVGWPATGYLWAGARRPKALAARALLSPFDPLIWFRDRALRLFGFHYRIEIYTPAAQRKHGYYVLPFLLDDQLVARVDLKSDRAAGVLRVQSAWLEPGQEPLRVARELAAELAELAWFLRLPAVEIVDRGDLAGLLRRVA